MAANRETTFSADYRAARRRFQQAALQLGWGIESYSIGPKGPDGEDLSFDVAISGGRDSKKVLVVSSGLHGVEGYFGSAVQVALLEQSRVENFASVKCVFLHGLNPYGFAWTRRFDENNIDPNRNFLLPSEAFEGSPEGYADLDPFLNPQSPPSRWEPFTLKALALILRYGMPSLRQAIASGQYDFPRGLFFGGKGPSRMQQILDENMPRWLCGSDSVVHLDFHTGLGRHGAYKLLIDYPLTDKQRRWLTYWFGHDSFEACESSSISYDARGGFGRWCTSKGFATDYLFACAEFGTYGPLRVLAGLRAENQAHFWSEPLAVSTIESKNRLKELFCPASQVWRTGVIQAARALVDKAEKGLLQDEVPG